MPDTITLQVARYRPDTESAPTMQEYVVPLHEDWAVLDGLNYIKDRLDGTLSFRWSCRMGICGSCGMMVNGDPALTCGTFLTDYAPGPVRVEPLANFPVIRDLVVDIDDFLRKLPKVKPWLVREDEQAGRRRRVPADAGRAGRVQAVQHVHQLHALLRGMPGVRACEPDFLGPAAIALAQRYNLDSRDQGAHQRLDVLASAEGVWACTYVGECTSACPKGVDPAGAIQRYKLTAATQDAAVVPVAARVRDERDRGSDPAAPTRSVPAADLPVLVAAPPVLPAVRAARAVQRVRRLVRRVPAAAGRRRPRGKRLLPGVPRPERPAVDAGTPTCPPCCTIPSSKPHCSRSACCRCFTGHSVWVPPLAPHATC